MLRGPRQSPVAAACVAVGRLWAGSVGRGNGVNVGSGVALGVSVGGNGVAVGIACWVAATMVQAAATDVFCTSAGAMVGVPCDPQADNRRAMPNRMGATRFNISSPFYD